MTTPNRDSDGKREKQLTPDKFDLYWYRIREIIAFFAGLAIMGFEAFHDKSDRPWLYGAAIGMMGLPVARYAEAALSRFTNGPQASADDKPRRRNRRTEK